MVEQWLNNGWQILTAFIYWRLIPLLPILACRVVRSNKVWSARMNFGDSNSFFPGPHFALEKTIGKRPGTWEMHVMHFSRERLNERFFYCSLHIFPSSHLHISSSHLHVFSSSHLHISSSHLHICASSHVHIFTSAHVSYIFFSPTSSIYFSLFKPGAVPTKLHEMQPFRTKWGSIGKTICNIRF